MEREVRALALEQRKVEASLRAAASRHDLASARVLAAGIVGAKKQTSRLHAQRAALLSLEAQLVEAAATARVVGTLKGSADVVKIMNGLICVPKLAGQLREMKAEMIKAGVIQDVADGMMDDALGIDGDDALTGEADEEVAKVLDEVAGDLMASLPRAVATAGGAPGAREREASAAAEEAEAELPAAPLAG